MKELRTLGERERSVIEERRARGYRAPLMRYGGELEPQLRALLARLLPGVPGEIDLAAFVDGRADDPLGRGDRPPGCPPAAKLFELGLRALAARGFARSSDAEQDALIARMRRGEADDELGLPAKEFVDRLLEKALTGYLAHPDVWERIGFNGPAYPAGYAWISRPTVVRRHEGFPGAARV